MTIFHLRLQSIDTCLTMHILLQEAAQHSETDRCILTTQINFCMLEICIAEARPTALFQGKVTSFLFIPTFTLAKIPEHLLWNRFHARNSQTQASRRNLFLRSCLQSMIYPPWFFSRLYLDISECSRFVLEEDQKIHFMQYRYYGLFCKSLLTSRMMVYAKTQVYQ